MQSVVSSITALRLYQKITRLVLLLSCSTIKILPNKKHRVTYIFFLFFWPTRRWSLLKFNYWIVSNSYTVQKYESYGIKFYVHLKKKHYGNILIKTTYPYDIVSWSKMFECHNKFRGCSELVECESRIDIENEKI